MKRFLMAALATLIFATAALAGSVRWPQIWSVGVIQTFDPRARSLVVKQGAHQMTFALAPAARILEGQAALDLDDLATHVGRRVKVRYAIVDEVKIADLVEITARGFEPRRFESR